MADTSTLLIAFLAANDAPCPGCGYNLRGLAGATCPECGEAVELDVRRESAGIWHRWLLPAFAWPAGLLLIAIGETLPLRGLLGLHEFVYLLWQLWFWVAGCIGCIALVAVVVRRRDRTSKRAHRTWLGLYGALTSGFIGIALFHVVSRLL